MINWVWKYRDFITAYDKCFSQSDWVQCYTDFYLIPNLDLLNEVYFRPRGFATKEDILRRIANLGGKGYFDGLLANIGDLDEYEQCIRNHTQDILSNFTIRPQALDLYVIIGLDCTNIYSTTYQGKKITLLCLESVGGDINKLQLLLSHECHHWIRDTFFQDQLFGNCIGERAVTEGLAISFSEYLFPGKQINDYCYVPEATVNWVIEHWDVIDKVICENTHKNDTESGFFTRNMTSGLLPGEPPRIGYVYGYLKVKEYMEKVKLNPIDLVGLNWKEVFQT